MLTLATNWKNLLKNDFFFRSNRTLVSLGEATTFAKIDRIVHIFRSNVYFNISAFVHSALGGIRLAAIKQFDFELHY